MTVRENILYGLDNISDAEMNAAARNARVDEVLTQVDLVEYIDAMPHELSGGQQQRVALARGIVGAETFKLVYLPVNPMPGSTAACVNVFAMICCMS